MAADPTAEAAPPPGFARHYRKSPLTDAWEPLYSRKADGVVAIGFRAAERHAHSRGFVPGGMLSARAHYTGLAYLADLASHLALPVLTLTIFMTAIMPASPKTAGNSGRI